MRVRLRFAGMLLALLTTGCDRPYIEQAEPSLRIVSPTLALALNTDSLALHVRAATFRDIASVDVNGTALRRGLDSLWTGRVGLRYGLNRLVLRATDAGGVSREETAYALRLAPTLAAYPLSVARAGHAAVRLRDGRVLVVGGLDRTGATARADAFLVDASTGVPTLLPTANALQNGRAGHTATLLPDGRVLVLGGVRIDGRRDVAELVTTVELYDPAQNRFLSASVRGAPPRNAYHQAFLVPGSTGTTLLAVLGGEGPTTAGTSPRFGERSDIRFFRIDPDGLTAVGRGAESGAGQNVGEPLAGFTATPLTAAAEAGRSGRLALFGSARATAQGQVQATAFGFLYDLGRSAPALLPAAAPPVARHRGAATRVSDGFVFVSGGAVEAATGTVPSAVSLRTGAEVYAAEADRHFTLLTAVGAVRYGHTLTPLGEGRVLVLGGFDGTGNAIATAFVVNTGLP